MNVENLFNYNEQHFPLTDAKYIPDECRCNVFIAASGNNDFIYCYNVDMKTESIRCWSIDISHYKRQMRILMQPYESEIGKIFYSYKGFELAYMAPHSACLGKEYIYVSPIFGNHIHCLSRHSTSHKVLCDDPFDVYCSTKHIVDDKMFFSKWSIFESFRRKQYADFISLDIGYISDLDHSTKSICTIQGADAIHDTLAINGNRIIMVEWPRFVDTKGRLILIDKDNSVNSIEVDGGPGHTIFNDGFVYLSRHNFLGNYCVGPGSIDKYQIAATIKKVNTFSDPLFYRIPSHTLYRYKGCQYLCVSVFPNQLWMIEKSTMVIYKKYQLRTSAWTSHGNKSFTYPRNDQTLYSVNPINDTPYVVLSNLWNIAIFDIEHEKIIYQTIFNMNYAPLVNVGHSLFY